jgi:hypothetical protein
VFYLKSERDAIMWGVHNNFCPITLTTENYREQPPWPEEKGTERRSRHNVYSRADELTTYMHKSSRPSSFLPVTCGEFLVHNGKYQFYEYH